MNILLTQSDNALLPAAMLAAMKAHLRITWNYDDPVVTEKLGEAIARLQTDCGIRIVPSKYAWTPASSDFCDGKARIPYPPVRTFAITGADQAGYSLEHRSIDGAPIVYLVGAWVDGLSVSVDTGFDDATKIPPDLTSEIQKVAAHLFEHREILMPGRDFALPPELAANATWWVPSV